MALPARKQIPSARPFMRKHDVSRTQRLWAVLGHHLEQWQIHVFLVDHKLFQLSAAVVIRNFSHFGIDDRYGVAFAPIDWLHSVPFVLKERVNIRGKEVVIDEKPLLGSEVLSLSCRPQITT